MIRLGVAAGTLLLLYPLPTLAQQRRIETVAVRVLALECNNERSLLMFALEPGLTIQPKQIPEQAGMEISGDWVLADLTTANATIRADPEHRKSVGRDGVIVGDDEQAGFVDWKTLVDNMSVSPQFCLSESETALAFGPAEASQTIQAAQGALVASGHGGFTPVGQWSDLAQEALEAFQAGEGISNGGVLDGPTRVALILQARK